MYEELKKLAKAAPEGPWFGPEYAPGTSYVFDVDLGTLLHYESIDTEQDACLRYVAAANPSAVLALIAENESLKHAIAAGNAREWDLRSQVSAAKESRARVVQSNKALRKECARLAQDVQGLLENPEDAL